MIGAVDQYSMFYCQCPYCRNFDRQYVRHQTGSSLQLKCPTCGDLFHQDVNVPLSEYKKSLNDKDYLEEAQAH